jgi:hypothetical protein
MTRDATNVHREVVSIGSPDDTTPESIAKVDSTGSLRTVSTDAAGTNQQAITVNGDAKVTLDGEVASVTSAGGALALDATLTGINQKTRIIGDTGVNQAKVTAAGNLQVSISASSATVTVAGTTAENTAPIGNLVADLPAKANGNAPSWTENGYVPLSVDRSGALRTRVGGTNNVSTTNQVVVGTAAVELLVSDAARRRALIQNTGTTVIYIGYGADPTTTVYYIALAPGVSADDGRGGVLIEEMYNGSIRAISSASGGTVVVTKHP